ncbi:MAG: hypothetical protein Q9225_007869 [Loekoesia sp. 1 TL-2023]
MEASNACPASEWYAIRDWLSAQKHIPPQPYQRRFRQANNLESCLIHGQNSARWLDFGANTGGYFPGPPPEFATTQQAVVADALSDVGALWFLSMINVTADAGHGSPLSDQSNAAHSIKGNYSQPYTIAVCQPDQITNTSDHRMLAFPFLHFVNQRTEATKNQTYTTARGASTGEGLAQVIELPNYTYSQLQDTPANAQGYRLKWFELPGNSFSGSSIGAVVVLPQSEPQSAQDVVLCNLAAGWALSSLEVETSGNGIGLTGSTVQEGNEFNLPHLPISRTQVPDDESNDPVLGDVFLGRGRPQRSINISESWAQFLNPWVESFNVSLLDVLWQEQLMEGDPGSNNVIASEIFVLLIANGLARTGWGSRLQGEVKSLGPNGQGGLDANYWLKNKGNVFDVNPNDSQEWITFRVDSTLQGYGYNTFTIPPRIAIAILTSYCLLVIGHVLYSGITGISSNCWDTVSELTALAINSTPTAALRNTCAGISELHIFKLPVRILVSKDEEGEGEHLELVFGHVNEDQAKEKTIKANRTYGTLPRVVEGQRKKDV